MKTKDPKKKSTKPAERTKMTAAIKAATEKISKTSGGKAKKTARKSPVKAAPKIKKTGIKTLPTKAVAGKAKVETKVKAKPKVKVSKVSATKPKPVEKIEKKTSKSATETSIPSKSVKSATESQIESKPRIKRTPAASRPKVSGITVMGRISNPPKKESPLQESSSFKISAAGEKADKKEIVARDEERVPLKSSKARLKIFLPEQNVTKNAMKEEAEEIFFGRLPEEYGENSVIALAVDPNTVFVDWEVIPKDISDIEGDLNLRFYDITGIEFNDWNAQSFFDVLINKRVGSGFFEIRMPGRDVVVAVGILNAVNGFMPIVRSDMVSFPELLAFDELGIVQNLFESGIPVGY